MLVIETGLQCGSACVRYAAAMRTPDGGTDALDGD